MAIAPPWEIPTQMLQILINIPQGYKDHAFLHWRKRRKARHKAKQTNKRHTPFPPAFSILKTLLHFPPVNFWEKIRKNSGQFICTIQTKEEIQNNSMKHFIQNTQQQLLKSISNHNFTSVGGNSEKHSGHLSPEKNK